jgi:hypothetical protein
MYIDPLTFLVLVCLAMFGIEVIMVRAVRYIEHRTRKPKPAKSKILLP